MSFIIVDAHNLFSRGRHVVRGDIDLKIGMCLHIMIASIKKCWSTLEGSHVVFAFDRRSWRKDFYPQYKFHRHEDAATKTPQEQEEDKLFYESFNDFHKFISEKTNCTVLEQHGLEADDLIAGWIQHHPNSKHVIISTDTDFYQLLAPNVKQYNGVTEELHTLEGIFDKYGKPVIDNKTKQPKEVPDPKWMLFEKIIRGDSTESSQALYWSSAFWSSDRYCRFMFSILALCRDSICSLVNPDFSISASCLSYLCFSASKSSCDHLPKSFVCSA